MKSIIAVLIALAPALSSAKVLTLVAGPNQIENVAIGTTATTDIAGRKAQLGLLGAGLRSKKVAIVNVKVYVAQLFADQPAAYTRTADQALASLDKMKTIAFQMSFVRDVEAVKVQTSFADALTANKVDVTGPEIKAFLAAVAQGGDALTGKTLTVVAERMSDGTELVTYESNNGQAVSIPSQKGFVRAVMSMWLGVAADSGLENLKKALIGLP